MDEFATYDDFCGAAINVMQQAEVAIQQTSTLIACPGFFSKQFVT